MLARVELKGIDGGSHKRWSMWFNSMQHEKPYQGLTLEQTNLKNLVSYGVLHRWCMAVVSSCREILGLVPQRTKPFPIVLQF
jgi:hypothetical protein